MEPSSILCWMISILVHRPVLIKLCSNNRYYDLTVLYALNKCCIQNSRFLERRNENIEKKLSIWPLCWVSSTNINESFFRLGFVNNVNRTKQNKINLLFEDFFFDVYDMINNQYDLISLGYLFIKRYSNQFVY